MEDVLVNPILFAAVSTAGSLVAYFVGFVLGRKSAPVHPVVKRLQQIERDKAKPFDGSDFWAKHNANLAADQREWEQEQWKREGPKPKVTFTTPRPTPIQDRIQVDIREQMRRMAESREADLIRAIAKPHPFETTYVTGAPFGAIHLN